MTALAGLSTSRPTAACDDQGMLGTVGKKIKSTSNACITFFFNVKKKTERRKFLPASSMLYVQNHIRVNQMGSVHWELLLMNDGRVQDHTGIAGVHKYNGEYFDFHNEICKMVEKCVFGLFVFF